MTFLKPESLVFTLKNAASWLALPAGRNTGGIYEETIKR
jgi:hypothetical protein